MENSRKYDFQQGEILLIDKPLNWTSFDVVKKIRWSLSRKFNVKRFKVGHAGTLDPLASGLLIICTGKKTKISEQLLSEAKVYTGTLLLGKTTPSYDLETEFNQEFPIDHITELAVLKVAESFLGEQQQQPPVFSAKKINGKRAYTYARKGEELELKKNNITVFSFEIERIELPEVDFKIHCSKGTYIRSIAHDFGKKLDSGATLTALRRIKSGDFSLEDAITVDEIVEIIDEQELL